MPWYNKYFTQEWQAFFYKLSAKKFHKHPQLIEDACQNAWVKLHEKLAENNRIIQSDPYVVSIFNSLLSDEYRSHFGRCRPREWVKRLGPFWVKIAEILCLDGSPPEVIAKQVCCQPPGNDQNCLEQVQEIVAQLQTQDYCSQMGAKEMPLSEHYEEVETGSGPRENLSQNELSLLVNAILNVDTDPEILKSTSNQIIARWQDLSTALDSVLSDDDRLILISFHIEGHKLSRVARDLNIKEHKLRYQHKKIIAAIKSCLKQHEIDPGQF